MLSLTYGNTVYLKTRSRGTIRIFILQYETGRTTLVSFQNLHRGQRLGMGEAEILWPGLNSPVADPKHGQKNKIQPMPTGRFQDYQEHVAEVRDLRGRAGGRRQRQTPLERGWTSARPAGKTYQPPLAKTRAENYDDFQTILLEAKVVTHMTGRFGRKRSLSQLFVTGNKRGLAGFSLKSTATGRSAAATQKGINSAGAKLMKISLYEDRKGRS